MAGPETALALGQPDLTADELAAGQQAASAPLAPLGPIGGAQQAQQRSSGQGQVNFGLQQPQLNPQRAYSAQEFYPGQERPNESRTAAGDPLFAASAGRIPWGIIADRAAQIQKQKAELSDYFRKQQDQFSGQAAPQYERDYQAWATNQDAQFKKDWADAHHGGNINAALEDLYKNPASNAAYQARMRDVKAAGVANKFYTTQAQDYIDGVLSGSVQPDPDLLREAQWFTSANAEFGPNSDSAAMRADHAKMWDKLVSRDKLFTDYYSKELAHAQDEAQAAGGISWRNGVRVIDETLKKDYDRFIDKAAREMTHNYGTGSYEENKRFLESRLGNYKVTNTTAAPQPQASAQQPQRPVISDFQITEDAMVPKINGHAGSVMTFKLQDKDRKPLTETFQFVSPGGAQRSMVPDRLSADKNGKVYIIGKDPTVTEVSVEDAAKARSLEERIKDLGADIDREKRANSELGQNALSPEKMSEKLAPLQRARDEMIAQKAGIEKTTTKRNAEFALPLDLNEAPIRATFGDEYVDKVKKNAEAYRMQSTGPAKSAPKTSADPLGIL